MSHEFDEDTALEPAGDGRFLGRYTSRWNVGPVPNGGYVLSVGLHALASSLDAPDPLCVTAHYLGRAVPGPVEVLVEVPKRGKTYSTATARLLQGGKEHARLLATFGDLSREGRMRHVAGAPPEVPDADAPRVVAPFQDAIEIGARFDLRLAPECAAWMNGGARRDEAEIRGRIRFADGRAPDVLSLPLFADAFPPPVLELVRPTWIPTLELAVQLRARPVPGWLRCQFRTRFVMHGLLEEDGEIWDESGTLVALSRQLAITPE